MKTGLLGVLPSHKSPPVDIDPGVGLNFGA